MRLVGGPGFEKVGVATLARPGWLYFELLLQLIFSIVPKKKVKLELVTLHVIFSVASTYATPPYSHT